MSNKNEEPSEGDLQVWWNPQVGSGCPDFIQEVDSLEQAILVMDTLAMYDAFQLANNIKPDYSNTGGLQIFENDEWVEWESEDGESIDEWRDTQEED